MHVFGTGPSFKHALYIPTSDHYLTRPHPLEFCAGFIHSCFLLLSGSSMCFQPLSFCASDQPLKKTFTVAPALTIIIIAFCSSDTEQSFKSTVSTICTFHYSRPHFHLHPSYALHIFLLICISAQFVRIQLLLMKYASFYRMNKDLRIA